MWEGSELSCLVQLVAGLEEQGRLIMDSRNAQQFLNDAFKTFFFKLALKHTQKQKMVLSLYSMM